MGKSGYLERQQEIIKRYRMADKDTYTQYMVDIFLIVLNDPEIMGKNVLGKDRLARVVEGVNKTYDRFALALTKDVEADYWQEKLDSKLRSIVGDDRFTPFSKRYEWIFQTDYSGRKK